MTQLSELSPEDRGLLVGLTYRTGVWMSHADDEEGERDDIREMKALEHIIRSIAKVHEQCVFVQDVARECLERKDKWPVWAEHSFDILADCGRAVEVLETHVHKDDIKSYKATLLNIAETVAAAHGEFGMEAGEDEGVLGGFLNKMTARFRGEAADAGFVNISPAEQAALDRLGTVLSMDD